MEALRKTREMRQKFECLVDEGEDKVSVRHIIGRFVKQEPRERWQAKRKLVSGSKHRGTLLL